MLQTRSSGSFDLLSMSLIDPPSNFASTGLSTPAGVKLSTPALYPKAAITDNGFDISNVQSYWSYTALSWTPPMDVAGRRFVVCVQATDRLGASAVRCVELSVARCVYCTLAGDTLRSVAAAYHSNWLQVWSTNQGRWSELEDTELASAGLARWSNTSLSLPPHSPALTMFRQKIRTCCRRVCFSGWGPSFLFAPKPACRPSRGGSGQRWRRCWPPTATSMLRARLCLRGRPCACFQTSVLREAGQQHYPM
mmetsp:Transcript_88948/g.237178  ORF Transcript_88948/g.237178 Transcript_88948/m.237178 type:complete len:251 (-) Transcript_88948:407-1159(-)